ncbi:chromate transporter [Halonatronum saccharophilum]|uniref:chromate transporter n=1 Tax=Halonatronum saccharophilum TaxID=150060 RepID=UPI0004871714|nr:chromate transporter [Halonatronum saccharophilum]
METALELFIVFFRIGAFTFGGGYAMLPIIQREIVKERGWANAQEIMNYYAISQCTPGIISINTATLIGYKINGIKGALASTAGMLLPSLIIITTIAAFFQIFFDYPLIQYAFNGIKIGVIALIINIVIKMWKQSVDNWIGVFLFWISFLLLTLLRLSPIIVIINAAIIGILFQSKRLSNKKIQDEGDGEK